jgi:hypothetical protein
MPADADQKSNGVVVLFSGFAATVSAIWGYDAIACKGVLAGAASAIMRAGFLVFVHSPTLLGCVGLLAAFLGVAHWLTRRPAFRKRQELVTFVLPTLALLGGIALGVWADIGLICALHPRA